MTERRLTIRQCASRLGVHEKTVRRYVARGLLRTFSTPAVSKYGVRHRILETDLERFIARHLVGPTRIESPRIVGVPNPPATPAQTPENPDETSTRENLA